MKSGSKNGWSSLMSFRVGRKSAVRFSLFPKVRSAGQTSGNAPVYLNVYDLTPLNGYVYWAGLGIFHSGVEVYGVEYAFGAHDYATSGVFEVEPKQCPGFRFRKSIFMGTTCLDPIQVREFMEHHSANYNGDTYHLIIKNCNHFCKDVCYKLTGNSIPKWVNRLARIGNDQNAIANIVDQLNQKFAMKHLGPATEFLGIKISHLNQQYFLSQPKYAQRLLQQANLSNCNPLANPTCTKLPATFPADSTITEPTMYRRLTGSLQYLTLTRPDIAYSVNLLSQHMHNPLPQHIYLLKRLLLYIKGTIEYGIPITKTNLLLKSFSDADWAGDPLSRKSTSGYCTFLGETLISWTVKKQHTVSRSSTESEYRALAALTSDIIWIRQLLTDFGIPQHSPTDLYCDNTSAIALANNPVFHARTKHIEIDQKFIRDHIQTQSICLLPISTVDQVADIFTKSLSTPRFHQLRLKLTVTPPPSACGGILDHIT